MAKIMPRSTIIGIMAKIIKRRPIVKDLRQWAESWPNHPQKFAFECFRVLGRAMAKIMSNRLMFNMLGPGWDHGHNGPGKENPNMIFSMICSPGEPCLGS